MNPVLAVQPRIGRPSKAEPYRFALQSWLEEDPQVTSPPGGDLPAPPDAAPGAGSLQVLEPPATSGLVDSIVGDVVASFLGK